MNSIQTIFLLLFTLLNCGLLLKSFHECKTCKNAFGLTRPLFFIGAFVWADVVVFSTFWVLVSAATLLLKSWNLFLLITSLFWVVRSFGEIIYWFNQQFSTINRNPIETLPFKSVFHNDSIWFVHQIFWQCVMVISLVSSIYFAAAWLK